MVDRRAFDLSVLLLTEDGAERAHETIEAIARRMLLLVEPGCSTNRVAFVAPSKVARDVMAGNQWRSSHPKDIGLRNRITLFARFLADKLLEGHLPPGRDAPCFVFMHFDGDHAWADRDLAKGEKVADLASFFARHAVPALDHVLHEHNRRGGGADVEACRRAALLRLRRLTPFYSVEAWLFQNTTEAERLCAKGCGRHVERIRRWADDRGRLDELDGDAQPKNQLPCIVPKDHVALATEGYPAKDVVAVRKSYAFAVDNLRRCRDLRDALRLTVPGSVMSR
jgi:hypothetical protein